MRGGYIGFEVMWRAKPVAIQRSLNEELHVPHCWQSLTTPRYDRRWLCNQLDGPLNGATTTSKQCGGLSPLQYSVCRGTRYCMFHIAGRVGVPRVDRRRACAGSTTHHFFMRGGVIPYAAWFGGD